MACGNHAKAYNRITMAHKRRRRKPSPPRNYQKPVALRKEMKRSRAREGITLKRLDVPAAEKVYLTVRVRPALRLAFTEEALRQGVTGEVLLDEILECWFAAGFARDPATNGRSRAPTKTPAPHA